MDTKKAVVVRGEDIPWVFVKNEECRWLLVEENIALASSTTAVIEEAQKKDLM